MNDIQVLALGEQDYPFGTYHDDSNAAHRRLIDAGYSRLQIQRAIVRELERLDVAVWNEYQSAVERWHNGECSREFTEQAQAKTYRIRERFVLCSRELVRQTARQMAKA